MLHITNGDHAVAVLSKVVQGSILPWRDVLHEGPVREGLSLEDLSHERAAFIADARWGPLEKILEDFEKRDAAFRRAGEHDEIVLWFEHDLYDQVQLIQVLDGLAGLRGPAVSLICEAEYLGTMAPERAAELFALRNPLVRKHFQEAQVAWAAFRSPDPRQIEKLRITSLPFLSGALRRHLEEFPWTTDGLSRTERQIVHALGGGPLSFPEIFRRTREDPVFLGDTLLAWHLERLQKEGLLERRGAAWALTGAKRQQRLPRWLGGYEVRNQGLRWDPGLGRLAG